MNPNLDRIQQRIDAYEQTVDEFVKEFHDEKTMAYFSDRFGPDHSLSARADQGDHLRRKLQQLRVKLEEFANQVLEEFPEPANN